MKNLFHENDYAEIVSRLKKLTPESERQWGTMTVNQMICHCTDPLRTALSELSVKMKDKFHLRTIAKWLIFYVIGFPKGKVKTFYEFDPNRGGTKPTNFNDDLKTLLATLKQIHSTSNDFKFHAHPAFGKLSRKEWGRVGYVHFDHHLRQFGV